MLERASADEAFAVHCYGPLGAEDRKAILAPLADFVLFRGFAGELSPVDLADSDQYVGYSVPGGCEARVVEAARTKFQAHPLVLEAIEQNAGEWAGLEGSS